MERKIIRATLREGVGKTAAKQMRAAGMVPAVLYGRGIEAVNIAVPLEEAQAALAGGAHMTHVYDLSIPDRAPMPVMITEVQRNPLSRMLLNLDFHVISLTEKVHSHVPVTLSGDPAGLRRGGIIERVHNEILVSCLPTDIPDHIEIDISALDIGDAIHARDLPVPDGVEILNLTPDETIVHLLPPAKAVEEVAAPTEEAAEPEVITAKEREEEE